MFSVSRGYSRSVLGQLSRVFVCLFGDMSNVVCHKQNLFVRFSVYFVEFLVQIWYLCTYIRTWLPNIYECIYVILNFFVYKGKFRDCLLGRTGCGIKRGIEGLLL